MGALGGTKWLAEAEHGCVGSGCGTAFLGSMVPPKDGVDDAFTGCGMGQQSADDAFGVGAGVIAEVPLDMVVKVHEGGETEPGVGQLPDEGRGLGEGLLLSWATAHWWQNWVA